MVRWPWSSLDKIEGDGNGNPEWSGTPFGLSLRAKVTRVIDGDTVVATLEIPVNVRLKDCWAPEMNSEGGVESKKAMEDLALGKDVAVHVDTTKANNLSDLFSFGRIVADITVTGDEKTVSQKMIDAGYAMKTKGG